MASTTETGHAKNVANFEDLIDFIEGYGTAYNPSQTAIKLTELKKLHTKAQTDITAVSNASASFKPATNAVSFPEVRPFKS